MRLGGRLLKMYLIKNSTTHCSTEVLLDVGTYNSFSRLRLHAMIASTSAKSSWTAANLTMKLRFLPEAAFQLEDRW